MAIEDVRVLLQDYGFETKKSHIDAIFRRCDWNEDWRLNFDEFLQAIGRSGEGIYIEKKQVNHQMKQ